MPFPPPDCMLMCPCLQVLFLCLFTSCFYLQRSICFIERRSDNALRFLGSLPTCRNQERHPGIPRGQQGPQALSHHLRISRKLYLKQRQDWNLRTPMWGTGIPRVLIPAPQKPTPIIGLSLSPSTFSIRYYDKLKVQRITNWIYAVPTL